jgi:hypothetical protein
MFPPELEGCQKAGVASASELLAMFIIKHSDMSARPYTENCMFTNQARFIPKELF